MTYKYLPILLLLVSSYAHAKNNAGIADSSEQIPPTFTAENSSYLSMPKLSATYRGGNSGGGGAYFFYGIELGYASVTAKENGTSYTSGGFMYNGELGAKIALPGRNANKTGLLSISLSGSDFSIKEKYTSPLGNPESVTRAFSVVGLPISYTNMGYGRNGTGFYWQVGMNTDYMYQVKDGGNPVTNQFNNIYFEPSVSCGLNMAFHVIRRHGGGEVAHGRALLGPFFQDAVTNLSKERGITMHGYIVGVRYAYVFM